MISLNEPSNKPTILLQPRLPQLCLDDPVAFFDQITAGLLTLRSEIYRSMIKCLDRLISSGKIASYKDYSEKYLSWSPSCSLENSEDGCTIWNLDNLCFIDLKYQGFINCIFLSFEVSILNTSPVTSPDNIRKYMVSPSFISVPKPWGIYLSHWSNRKLRRMEKFRFIQ